MFIFWGHTRQCSVGHSWWVFGGLFVVPEMELGSVTSYNKYCPCYVQGHTVQYDTVTAVPYLVLVPDHTSWP